MIGGIKSHIVHPCIWCTNSEEEILPKNWAKQSCLKRSHWDLITELKVKLSHHCKIQT